MIDIIEAFFDSFLEVRVHTLIGLILIPYLQFLRSDLVIDWKNILVVERNLTKHKAVKGDT